MQKRTGTVFYYDNECVSDNGESVPYSSMLPTKENTEDQVIAIDLLKRLLSDPDQRRREIYQLLAQGYTQQEIAAKVKISQPRVSRIQRAAKVVSL